MKKIISNSVKELKNIKWILLVSAVVTIISIGMGFYLSASTNPFIVDLKQDFLQEIKDMEVLNDISRQIISGNVFSAIGMTFIFNLISGAFFSTTVTGLIFPLPLLISFERGILVGMVYGGVEGNWAFNLILIGTFILEFGAYIISSALGVNIGLSFFSPKRFNTSSRWKAFGRSWKQAFKIYPLVIILLLVGAIYEIGGLYLLVK